MDGPVPGESLKPLLELQEIDLHCDRLRERLQRLPEREELAAHTQRAEEIRAAIARLEAEIEELVRSEERLEADVRSIEDKISREESKLYGGEVVNPKELSALQAEIEMLRRRKSPIEEQAVELLVRRDELFAERDALQAELADVQREAEAVRARLAEAAARIEAELAEQGARRQQVLPKLPADVVELYEQLRAHKRGIGVGALENGVCTACREALSAVEVDRIKQAARAGETRFRCEHCRRILVVT